LCHYFNENLMKTGIKPRENEIRTNAESSDPTPQAAYSRAADDRQTMETVSEALQT
jgi:hypothetical protein